MTDVCTGSSELNAINHSFTSLKVFGSSDYHSWLVFLENMEVLVTQLCLTLCDPMNCRPPDSSVCGILQARLLEWVAIPFSRRSSQPKDGTTRVSHISGRFSTVWATGEALSESICFLNKFSLYLTQTVKRSLAGCSPWGLKKLDTTEHAGSMSITFLTSLLVSKFFHQEARTLNSPGTEEK